MILGLGIGGFGIYGHFRKGGRTKVRKSSKCGSYKETPAGIRLADYTSFESILTSGDHFPPDYDANTAKWTSSLMSYLGCDVRAENAEFDRIVEWFAGFSSVHQCSLGALKSIGEMGAVASLNLLSNAWRNVDELARLVWLRPGPSDFAATTLYSPGKQDQLNAAKGFVRAYCRIVQGERSPKIVSD